ncbi:hypothetical protein FNH05_06555 [Amycolatopsis rhizosphaerae]|uniref:Uncharacterized protein n=1 Tax=Amycolatopsis rhizosphaerae TaxID=2053003 RepID=A0A558DBQ9_9PSEU|nr:hypothetical protein [Amycolatopsis rhizosphaerae]TVT58462.1 hypothetical protein FNH05_06555 [Amycolatopsis rhizosphaerae]
MRGKIKARIASGMAAGLLVAGIGAAVAAGTDSGSSTDSAFRCTADSCYGYRDVWPGSDAYWEYHGWNHNWY